MKIERITIRLMHTKDDKEGDYVKAKISINEKAIKKYYLLTFLDTDMKALKKIGRLEFYDKKSP